MLKNQFQHAAQREQATAAGAAPGHELMSIAASFEGVLYSSQRDHRATADTLTLPRFGLPG
ncbi:MAG: hypothetical protein V3S36_07935 [Acidiferrobacterales bacterium]|jgi:hypothetical protein